MTTFLDSYLEGKEEDFRGIPGIVMNAPYIPANKVAHIGLELEVEGRRLPSAGHLERVVGPKSGSRWTAVNDGSLRGEAVEYVLNTPCYVDEVDTMLAGMWEVFKERSTTFSISNRCSTHVHVNAGGSKINELIAVVALWTTFEEALIAWCGESRQTNHFCVSSKDSEATIEAWRRILERGSHGFGEGFKYTALNARRLFDLGSLEFRSMRMDEDWTVISNWSKFIYTLVDYARTEYRNPQALAHALSERGATGIFSDICRRSGVTSNFFSEVTDGCVNFEHKSLEGFRRAQPLVMGYPWYDWMPLIDKEYIPSPFKSAKPKGRRTMMAVEEMAPFGLGEDAVRAFQPAPPVRRAFRMAPPKPPGNIDFDAPLFFPDGTPFVDEGRPNDISIQGRSRQPIYPFEGWRADLHSSFNYDSEGWWSGRQVEYITNWRNLELGIR